MWTGVSYLTWTGITHHVGVNACLLVCARVKFLLQHSLDSACASGSSFAIVSGVNSCALHGESLVHDRASSSDELEVRDRSSTRRLASGSRERAKGCWRGLFEEGTHALRLAEQSLHGCVRWL